VAFISVPNGMLREPNFVFGLFRHRYLGRVTNYSIMLIYIWKLQT